MSVEAISRALNLAPVPAEHNGQPSSSCKFVLAGLSNHAGQDRSGAFPSVRTLIRYTGLSERTVRTCLDRLKHGGLIRPCDPGGRRREDRRFPSALRRRGSGQTFGSIKPGWRHRRAHRLRGSRIGREHLLSAVAPCGGDMAERTLVWRGLDEPRMEIVHVEGLERAHGTQIGIAYELRWNLNGAVLELTRDGGPAIRVELGGADFFDLHHSAFFNSLPVARDGLLNETAEAREYTMRFVRVPELTAELVRQRYEPLGNRVVRYSSNSYQANITFDADGFVTLYQDYLERVG